MWDVHPDHLQLRASCQGLRDKGVSAATLAEGTLVIGDQVGSLWVHYVSQDMVSY